MDKTHTSLLADWFASRGWQAADFQLHAWQAFQAGDSGLIHSPTGSGKTAAAWGGPVLESLQQTPRGLCYLWITPLRALANDTRRQLQEMIDAVDGGWEVATRTGDTSSSQRAKIRRQPPPGLITTPESLSLMLSYKDRESFFGKLRAVIVDEWHELIGSKRGVLLMLSLAFLRARHPELRIWGISATLGNLDQALDALTGSSGRLISGSGQRPVEIKTLIPPEIDRFPRAGHLGMALLKPVVDVVRNAKSTLVFTNTRSQAELWYNAIISVAADLAPVTAIHHGSIDRKSRHEAEVRLSEGALKCLVATSSLDLGVDFSPVDQVVQIGSPKGVARLAQRAGRSSHAPGKTARIICVPTHAMELIDMAAARDALNRGEIEARSIPQESLDVLAQHLITLATGGGFKPAQTLKQVRSSYPFRNISDADWQWTLSFIQHGSPALSAYPHYRKVVQENGNFVVTDQKVARQHRMAVGTITSDGSLLVKFMRGASLGQIEEQFLSRLEPGDKFLFAGRILQLVRIKDMTAYVRLATGKPKLVPRWQGGRLPLSNELAHAVLRLLAQADQSKFDSEEMQAARHILELQDHLSELPTPEKLLIEQFKSREGQHFFLYPFAGRLAHEGLGTLLAYRLGQKQPGSFSIAANDYGIEVATDAKLALNSDGWRALLNANNLVEDILSSLNASELSKRKFRDIARIAGLIFAGHPGRGKTTRQIQASTGLIFDVLKNHDPEHRLLYQAQQESLRNEFDLERLQTTLRSLETKSLAVVTLSSLSPFGFPLWAERLRHRLTTDQWQARIDRMRAILEKL